MHHHAFAIEAEADEGIGAAQAWVRRELGMEAKGNPDVIVLSYGLLSVEDARRVAALAAQAPLAGAHKALVVAASRAYHEAQNALLKLFEEPPAGTYLFLVLPTLGGLLPTLRSRVQTLPRARQRLARAIPEAAEEFLKASREKRSAIAKRLASGRDDEERRENRDEALAIVNGVEAACAAKGFDDPSAAALLRDLSVLRDCLHDRAAPVRMILEHLALVTPSALV